MIERWKRTWRQIRDGTPGRRFRDHYRARRERRGGGGTGSGLPSLLGGGALALAGVVLLFVPGPGIVLILVGGALMARESKTAAHALDRLELLVRPILEWGRRTWQGASGTTRALAALLGAALAVLGGGVLLRVWFGG